MSLLENLLRKSESKIYAFTILMRQAPTAFTPEEEKQASLVKQASSLIDDRKAFQTILREIPAKVWDDYMGARKRNLEVNLKTLSFAAEKWIDFAAVSLDDLSSQGINRMECLTLEKFVSEKKLSDRAAILPGTDETSMLLLARALLESNRKEPRVFPIYSLPDPDRFTLRYEDRPLGRIVKEQIHVAGARMAKSAEDADLLLFIHSPRENQLDVPLRSKGKPDPRWLAGMCEEVERGASCILADLRYANGADGNLMRILAKKMNLSKLLAFSAWNTAANALGIALSDGLTGWLALQSAAGGKNKQSEEARTRSLCLRFMEDWFYQAEIRPLLSARIREQGSSPLRLPQDLLRSVQKEVREKLEALSQEFLKPCAPGLHINRVRFPWDRLFELEIDFSL